jgi:hypothetical protein
MILNPWKEIERLREELRVRTDLTDMWRKSAMLERKVTDELRNDLLRIAAEEKPTSNATVKRMARMAREALKK